ncbi:helix-turn-helix domain-containing protein [Alicyclobacillus sendaiensis]|uniref:helix-turn-helix domain-containing protein n=1 Tax=Alicyclobacillus sendaiensis TaxID=192387 RepID=UPI0026F4426D|nr:helix-turn-helix transcriptional regulator [Alicyclobacillus sendaiensis]
MDVDVAARLRQVRESRGISQYRLSKLSGVAASAINKVESGVTNPTVELMERLCSALGVTLSEFFSDEQPSSDRISRLTPEQRQALERFLETLERS